MSRVTAPSPIPLLISQLEGYVDRCNRLKHKSVIPRPRTLIDACRKLDQMIGLYQLKCAVVTKIQVVIVRGLDINSGSLVGGQMLHYCVCGPPGVGKSQVSRLIAKIWYALGADLPIYQKISTPVTSTGPSVHENVAIEIQNRGNELIAKAHSIQRNLIQLQTLSPTLSGSPRASRAADSRSTEPTLNVPHSPRPVRRNEPEGSLSNSLSNIPQSPRPVRHTDLPLSNSCTLPNSPPSNGVQQSLNVANTDRRFNMVPRSPSASLIRSAELPPSRSPRESIGKAWQQFSTDIQTLVENATSLNHQINSIVKLDDEVPGDEVLVDTEGVEDNPNVPESEYLVIAGREDLVAPYLGQTATLANNFITEHLHKTIILEEAYSLCTGPTDIFGAELLVVINRTMDEMSDSVRFCFNGYRNALETNIFAVQPGIGRRIDHFYETTSYSSAELAEILVQQLAHLHFEVQYVQAFMLIRSHSTEFPNFAGDTLRLARAVENSMFSKQFSNCLLESTRPNRKVELSDLEDGFREFKSSRLSQNLGENLSMYV